jgi:hypothetical protein
MTGGVARRVLQLEHFHAALGLIATQCRTHVTRVYRSMRGGESRQLQVERDGIFKRQLAAGPDAEVRGVRRVAQQHQRHASRAGVAAIIARDVEPVHPVGTGDAGEPDPLG